MSKKLVVAAIGIAILVGVVIAVFALKNNSSNDMTNMPTAKSQSTTGATQTATTNAVTIKDFAFSPAKINVKVGTKVTWTNQDSTPHTVTADSGSGPDSGTMNQGQTYSFTYDTVGSFPYHCNFHSNMTGTVEVTQ